MYRELSAETPDDVPLALVCDDDVVDVAEVPCCEAPAALAVAVGLAGLGGVRGGGMRRQSPVGRFNL